MTPDHISVTPYYDGPQTTDDQIASLPELKWDQKIVGDVKVSLLGDDAALRTFTADLKGSFKGKVFATEMAYEACDHAMQTLGALGMTLELPLNALSQKARLMRMYEGPSEVHRQSIARRVLGLRG